MDNEHLLAELSSIRSKYSRTLFDYEKLKQKVKSLESENVELLGKIACLEQKCANSQKNEKKDKNEHSLESQLSELKIQKSVSLSRSNRAGTGSSQKKSIEKNIHQNAKKNVADYEVERLMDHEVKRNRICFLVRWKGFGSDQDSWEPESNLNCPEILSAYKKKNKI